MCFRCVLQVLFPCCKYRTVISLHLVLKLKLVFKCLFTTVLREENYVIYECNKRFTRCLSNDYGRVGLASLVENLQYYRLIFVDKPLICFVSWFLMEFQGIFWSFTRLSIITFSTSWKSMPLHLFIDTYNQFITFSNLISHKTCLLMK